MDELLRPTYWVDHKEEEHYFQFPLCLLALPFPPTEKFWYIHDYAVTGLASKILSQLYAGEWVDKTDRHGGRLALEGANCERDIEKYLEASRYDWEPDKSIVSDEIYDFSDDIPIFLLVLAAAAERLDANVWASTLDRSLVAEEAYDSFKRRFGEDAFVRIRTDIFYSFAREDRYRDFAVLSAIYSKIGSKDFTRMSNREIARRASGMKSKSAHDVYLAEEGSAAISRQTIRSAVDVLWRQRFFAKVTARRNTTYFSNKMSDESLRDRIAEDIVEKDAGVFKSRQRSQDDAMNAKIRDAITHQRSRRSGDRGESVSR